jgi:hypothetical protein
VDPTVKRIIVFMSILAPVGIVFSAVRGGMPAAVGFACGSALSFLNLWVFRRVVERVGATAPATEGDKGPPTTAIVLAGLRYLLFAAVAYVILNVFAASLLAALAGCFVLVAAVILAILYELIYGT